MSTLDLRAPSVTVRGTVGDDLSITVTVTDSAGDPIDLSGYTTIQADVFRNGTSVATFTDSLGGAGNNVITLTLTDAQTTTIGNERGLTWSLEVDADGSSVTQWLAGEFRLYTQGTPGTSSSTSVALTASGSVSLTATTVAPLATLDGRYAPLDHLTDTDDAHDATAISVADVFNSDFSAGDVSEALVELDDKIETRATLRMINAVIGNVVTWDDFLGDDNASSLSGRAAPGGGTWTVVNGTWGITSNRAYVSALASGNAIATITGVRNGYAAVTVSTNLGTRQQGVIVRYIDDDNYIFVNRITSSGGNGYLVIRKMDAGVDSILATSGGVLGQTLSDAARIECWFQGETIAARFGGTDVVHRLTGGDETKYDVGNTVGIGQSSTPSIGASSWFDNFVVVGQ